MCDGRRERLGRAARRRRRTPARRRSAASASCWQAYGLPSQPSGSGAPGRPGPAGRRPSRAARGAVAAIRRRGRAPRGQARRDGRECLPGRRSRGAPRSGPEAALRPSPGSRGRGQRWPAEQPAVDPGMRGEAAAVTVTRLERLHRAASRRAQRHRDDAHADAARQRHRRPVEEGEVGEHAGPVRPEVERERRGVAAACGRRGPGRPSARSRPRASRGSW